MMRALLDINVAISLLDPDHDFHQRAHVWWADNRHLGWATSPLTENGVVRIMSHPAYNPRRSLTPGSVVTLLQTFLSRTDHEFWPDSVSLLDRASVESHLVLGPRQVTYLYLLALAVARGGRLVTFDESVNRRAVVGARAEHLVVV